MNRLRELRKNHGLTLKELGKKVSMHDNTLSQYETGKRNPSLKTWQQLADFYGVSVSYLQGRYDHLTKKEALQTIHEIMTICGISKEELKDRL
ncbi:helix-turn-helix domain-containing protein [Lactobacillus crispatus]|jgi:putative transcriptional regulator|uniref:helix-turn-helix domain-containing protein n=1 Tax=Lactobacillus crispatus TaxID=47770 RepID=UPI0018E32AE4|nr:helix-turn-helix transcriptional regulator [Lactobacillus crispatus]MBI1706593.1 HTH-type transcriptional regulator immR [Lactobacillus crispatus]MBI1717905.1 HTH-type transcriptional regulator immR [Lactobacillus crispatus]MCT7680793.1 helix-turn-helix domain-containing protein [Lactobacillus crispatus]MCT7827446.1 helix-turn-helix domain-containing protein [Lactobacillus crispatus]MCZ3641920.1 helix-turn-helix domain-containing protein [Lactobacillus crispatus]